MPISLITPGSVQFNDNSVQTVSEMGSLGTARQSSSLQPISAGTLTKVNINTVVESIGTGITFNSTSNRWVISTPGVYLVTGIVRIAPGLNSGEYQGASSIFLNGTEYARGDTLLGWGQAYIQAVVHTTINCVANDFIELYGAWNQNTGSGASVSFIYDNTVLNSRLEVAYLRTSI